MGNNSAQGVALLVLLLAFTFLSIGMFYEGNIIFLALGVLAMAVSVSMFRKIKPLENQG